MSPLPLLLLPLLAMLESTPPATASLTTSLWHPALVTQDQLAAAATSTIYQEVDEIICAILANITPWCLLFTHESNTCVLYDVVVDSLSPTQPQVTATPCKIRHRNVCIVEGVPLAHGDTLVHDCLPTTCWNSDLVPTYKVSSTCEAPFTLVTAGCVYLHKKGKTWCKAREYCANLEAQLAVVPPEFFSKRHELLDAEVSRGKVWVGVKARKWVDGRDVSAAEWGPGEPNGNPEQCAFIRIRKAHTNSSTGTAIPNSGFYVCGPETAGPVVIGDVGARNIIIVWDGGILRM